MLSHTYLLFQLSVFSFHSPSKSKSSSSLAMSEQFQLHVKQSEERSTKAKFIVNAFSRLSPELVFSLEFRLPYFN